MTYPHLPEAGSGDRPASGGQVRQRLAYVRQQEQLLTGLRGFRREVAARTCARLRRETRLQLQAMRQLLHALCG
jgi:hypothetical protein